MSVVANGVRQPPTVPLHPAVLLVLQRCPRQPAWCSSSVLESVLHRRKEHGCRAAGGFTHGPPTDLSQLCMRRPLEFTAASVYSPCRRARRGFMARAGRVHSMRAEEAQSATSTDGVALTGAAPASAMQQLNNILRTFSDCGAAPPAQLVDALLQGECGAGTASRTGAARDLLHGAHHWFNCVRFMCLLQLRVCSKRAVARRARGIPTSRAARHKLAPKYLCNAVACCHPGNCTHCPHVLLTVCMRAAAGP